MTGRYFISWRRKCKIRMYTHAACNLHPHQLQRKFLKYSSNAVDKDNAPKQQLAYLSDRIRFNEDKPQLYRTVLDWNKEDELSYKLEDPINVDVRRNKMD